ncbi:DNA-binding CsgD family transcriptional regulator [Streptacidiphilus sp. MAP12-20]|uniref:helix-turn-helix transcriptional regulator n=1 Tax=Streptacidiphilus sp. MAP12-20 TaxID=3156299 RepID=UPI00351384FD
MTLVAASEPSSPSRVRIAITSPDILAQIRQAFAGRNLAVEIVSLPYVEVAVRPAAGAATAGPAAVTSAPRRLCAEYRLSVVAVADGPRAPRAVPAGHSSPAALPGADAGNNVDTDAPVVVLSQRQHEVMALVSLGVRNAEIALRLQVSEKTVKNHINRIFRSLGASSRVEAVLIWQRQQAGGTTRRAAPIPMRPIPTRPAGQPDGGRRRERGGNP